MHDYFCAYTHHYVTLLLYHHSAYATQFRKNGGTWSQTGTTGDALYLTFLKKADGTCDEVLPR